MPVGTKTGISEGDIRARIFQTGISVELWCCDTQSGTYEFLTALDLVPGIQSYTHKALEPNLERWYKIRLRALSGFYSDYSAAKKGSTSTMFLDAVPTNNPVPIAFNIANED